MGAVWWLEAAQGVATGAVMVGAVCPHGGHDHQTPAKKAQDTSEIFHLKPKGAKAARGAGNQIMRPMGTGAVAAPPGSPPIPPRG